MNIYYLGPAGSFSHILVQKAFTDSSHVIACDLFSTVISSAISDPDGIGVLAIENSITSSVHETVDLLYNSDVSIVGEASMQIKMNLIGTTHASENLITDIYSHAQALAQCSAYIDKHGLKAHEVSSTSEAVGYISEQNMVTKAAIGNLDTKSHYNLKVIQQDVANVPHNMTRWVFIAKEGTPPLGFRKNKLTYIFKVKHEPGSLVQVLKCIAEKKGNLTKIESRPLPGTHWEYGFWIDVEIDERKRQEFDTMMEEMTQECRRVGAYERGVLYDAT